MPEITLENFKDVLEKEPDLKNNIFNTYKPDIRKSLEEEGLIIRTKDEDDQYVQSNINTRVEGEIEKRFKPKFDTEFGAKMNELDKRIFEITSIQKQPNEKSTDYYARALSESKNGDPVTKAQNDELKQLLNKERTEWESKYNEVIRQTERREIEAQVDSALSTKQFPIPVHLKTEADKQAYVDKQKRLLRNDFLSTYSPKRDDAGNLIFMVDGKPMLSNKDGKSLNAQAIIDTEFAPFFLQSTHKATGTGAGANGNVELPTTDFKTKEDIHKYLGAMGLVAGEAKYMSEFKRYMAEAKIAL